jgi:hypothetical protein
MQVFNAAELALRLVHRAPEVQALAIIERIKAVEETLAEVEHLLEPGFARRRRLIPAPDPNGP